MKRLAITGLLLFGFAWALACIDFNKATDEWCEKNPHPGCPPPGSNGDGGGTGNDGGSRYDGGISPDAGSGPGTDFLGRESAGSTTDKGLLVWGRRYGGSADETGAAVAVGTNTIWVAGTFQGGAPDFATYESDLSNHGGKDIFLLQVDLLTGKPMRTRTIGGALDDVAVDLAVDAQDFVYLAGTFKGSLPLEGLSTLNAMNNSTEAFVAKFAPNGTLSRAVHLTSASEGSTIRIRSVAATSIGIVVTGQFEGSMKVGQTSIGSSTNPVAFVLTFSAADLSLTGQDTSNRCIAAAAESAAFLDGGLLVAGRVNAGQDPECVIANASIDPNASMGPYPNAFVAQYGGSALTGFDAGTHGQVSDLGQDTPVRLAASNSAAVLATLQESGTDYFNFNLMPVYGNLSYSLSGYGNSLQLGGVAMGNNGNLWTGFSFAQNMNVYPWYFSGPQSAYNAVIVKYSPGGAGIWKRHLGGPFPDGGMVTPCPGTCPPVDGGAAVDGVTVDRNTNTNPVVAGHFTNVMFFNESTSSFTSKGANDLYLLYFQSTP